MAELHLQAPISGTFASGDDPATFNAADVVYIHNCTTLDLAILPGLDMRYEVIAGYGQDKTSSAQMPVAARDANNGGIYRWGTRKPEPCSIRIRATVRVAGASQIVQFTAG